jgi:hypothetical protein
MRVCGGRRKIQRARTERGNANSRPAREAPVRRSHEAGGLLMARQHKLDFRRAKRFYDIQIFLAWYAKYAFNALVLQSSNQKI